MKNFKKTISLILAICMIASLAISASAANTVDASGGTGTSSVTLSGNNLVVLSVYFPLRYLLGRCVRHLFL